MIAAARAAARIVGTVSALTLMAAGPALCERPARTPDESRACVSCHAAQAAQPASPMGHAMEPVAECQILKSHALLAFQAGKYSYRIERKGSQSIYIVTDGVQTISVPIGWAFGLGQAGQTYVFEREGRLYESQVSYYKAIDGLDLTMGAINHAPLDLTAGRRPGDGQEGRRAVLSLPRDACRRGPAT